MNKMNFSSLTKGIKEKHANFIVSEVNVHCLRIAVLEGEYVWHFHPDTDELFIVLEGELLIDFKDRGTEVLKPNDTLLIPKGVIHRTRANARTVNLCMEQTSAETVMFNEGNVLKLICCKTDELHKQPFSEAQAKWSPLQNVKGFIRQWGGFRQSEDGWEAVIMALWESKHDYLNFMEHDHDAIFEKTNQTGTFQAIEVALIEGAAEINQALKSNCTVSEPGWMVDGRA
ncbi:DUF4937 domain-containing protein [Bacillus glycinifermentans]|uniref:Uncharacterized protein n=2 Tax=Bacillus glycinifermentans TaxID=1664069 RepID=A0A0T6BW31_9BACI|nr:DUF4937 domain-containing protein [Bacillus glycinifermentans]KRT95849.1 hypothetical protein AB447_201800 [Bacillus glycinifermentans]